MYLLVSSYDRLHIAVSYYDWINLLVSNCMHAILKPVNVLGKIPSSIKQKKSRIEMTNQSIQPPNHLNSVKIHIILKPTYTAKLHCIHEKKINTIGCH